MANALLTRELDPDSAYGDALAELGLTSIAMPVTRTEPARDPTALARALFAGDHLAIAVASTRAAAALVAARGDAVLPEVWAVGPATHRALVGAGIQAMVPPEAKDGATLAHAMVVGLPVAGRRVLVPRAEHGRPELIEILRAAGAVVDDVIAYRTVPVPADDPAIVRGRALLADGDVAVCVVFAPSQVRTLDALLGPLSAVAAQFAAIGDTTAAALNEVGVDRVAVASAPTPEALANAIAAVYPARV